MPNINKDLLEPEDPVPPLLVLLVHQVAVVPPGVPRVAGVEPNGSFYL